jgi:hypothetical protein
MSRATPELRRLAERLLRLEAGKRAAESGTAAAARVCEKLRLVLTVFLGAAGFRALLVRALSLTKLEAPGVKTAQVGADGSLEGMNEVESTSDRGKIAREETILVAHLLGLLLTFVGEALMLRLVQDAWPKVSLEAVDIDEGDDP